MGEQNAVTLAPRWAQHKCGEPKKAPSTPLRLCKINLQYWEATMPGKISNFFMKTIVNSPLHPLLGNRFAVVTFEGRKTGKRYSTPINVTRDGDAFTAVSLRNRNWWRNLRGGQQATLRVAGRLYTVRGEVLEDHGAVVDGLAQYFKQNPGYARYFGVRLALNGQPSGEDLDRAADERVIIRLSSVTA
jgi:deazaflavin-dependent oxidoreductase (nitroreductase family)